MLFNSFVFLAAFLPITLAAFWFTERLGSRTLTVTLLVAASLTYYGYWDITFLWLIVGSVALNYYLAQVLQNLRLLGRSATARWVLISGVVANLAPLAYYKYSYFVLSSVTEPEVGSSLQALILPLGISFFSFQQIAYLVDVKRGEPAEKRFLDYALFVTFFPQLIAGPIVHYSETLPQFRKFGATGLRLSNLSIGTAIFAIGLFKKTVIADGIAQISTPLFVAAGNGEQLAFVDAWTAALAYSFQLYFDFSAYSDMAIGVARMFGVRLPINFHAPYRATSIIDFWRRWHITLSRFLRDYVYFPMGGGRVPEISRYRNILATMLIGGLWHGAGWTFVIWGGLHGAMLVVNHLWRRHVGLWPKGTAGVWSARALTFILVVATWVPFRAEDFEATAIIWTGMAGLNGVELPITLSVYFGDSIFHILGIALVPTPLRDVAVVFLVLTGLTFWVWVLPTPYMLLRRYCPALLHSGGDACRAFVPDTKIAKKFVWRPISGWSILAAVAIASSCLAMMVGSSEFLYYQF